MRIALLIAFAGLVFTSQAGAQPSAREMRALSPRELATTLRRDLGSTLLFDEAIVSRRPGLVGIPGRPTGSSIPGLCARMFVRMTYALSRAPRPAQQLLPDGRLSGPRDDPRDIPLRPLGFGVEQQFIFISPPPPIGLTGRIERVQQRDSLNAPCPPGLTRRPGWFVADNDHVAMLGVQALRDAAAAVASGGVALDCAPNVVGDHTTCPAELQRLSTDLSELRAVRVAMRDDVSTAVVETSGPTVTITWAQQREGQPIRSVRMSETPVLIQE